jgi:hypothetical protein
MRWAATRKYNFGSNRTNPIVASLSFDAGFRHTIFSLSVAFPVTLCVIHDVTTFPRPQPLQGRTMHTMRSMPIVVHF